MSYELRQVLRCYYLGRPALAALSFEAFALFLTSALEGFRVLVPSSIYRSPNFDIVQFPRAMAEKRQVEDPSLSALPLLL